MTIKTFWTILIKVLGIWLVVNAIPLIIQSMVSIFRILGFNILSGLSLLAVTVLLLIFYALVLWLFVFRTSWLIDKLKLEEGFTEDRIAVNVSYATILNIAVIVIGGLLFADNLPALCKEMVVVWQQKSILRNSPEAGHLVFQAMKVIIGILLMTNSRYLVRMIDKRGRETGE